MAPVNFELFQSLVSPHLCPFSPSTFLGEKFPTPLLLEASGQLTQTHGSLPPPWGCPGLFILEALRFSPRGFVYTFQEAAELWGRAQTWAQSLLLLFRSCVTSQASHHTSPSLDGILQ